jgi:hypothetical protein
MCGRDSRAGLKSVMDGLVSVGQTIVNGGRLRIGALNGDLSANSSVTAAGVNDTGGSIVLEGNGSNRRCSMSRAPLISAQPPANSTASSHSKATTRSNSRAAP